MLRKAREKFGIFHLPAHNMSALEALAASLPSSAKEIVHALFGHSQHLHPLASDVARGGVLPAYSPQLPKLKIDLLATHVLFASVGMEI